MGCESHLGQRRSRCVELRRSYARVTLLILALLQARTRRQKVNQPSPSTQPYPTLSTSAPSDS